jgi:O-antigen ligase
VAIQPSELPGAEGPSPGAPVRPARRTFAPPSAAASAITVYTFLVIGRLPELVPGLPLLHPILLVGLVAIVFAAVLPPRPAIRMLKSREAYAVLGLLTMFVITIPTSYWPSNSLAFLIVGYSKTLTFFFLLLYSIRTLRELKGLGWAFLLAICALECAALLVKAQDTGTVVVSSTYDRNDLAFVMLCGLPVAVSLWVVARGATRWILLAISLLALVTTITTQSRGGFVTLLVVAPLILFRLPSRVPFLRVGVLVVGVAFFAVMAPQSYWDRITTTWSSEGVTDGYLKGGLETARWELWKTGMGIMMRNPILGVGAGNFAVAEGETHAHGKWTAPHNSYIQIGAELGLGGLALFMFLLYRTVRNYRDVVRLTRRDRRLQYYYRLASGLEVSTYAYIIGALPLSQAYSEIFYFLVATSVLFRHMILRRLARSAGGESGAAAGRVSLPWWKAS